MSITNHPAIQAASAAKAAQVREVAQETKAVQAAQDARVAQATASRPTALTPHGVAFTDNAAYALYAELTRIHDWLLAFQTDMENLSLSKPEAVARITAFYDTLQPAHGGLKTGPLELIRKSLDGHADIRLGLALSSLRLHIGNHWHYAMRSAGYDLEKPIDPNAPRCSGPFFKVAPPVNPAAMELMESARAAVLARQ